MNLASAAFPASSAANFVTTQDTKTSTAMVDLERELRYQAPLGLFDHLGMLADADQEYFDRLQYVEVNHGHIMQLAFLGQITTQNSIHLSGDIYYSCDSFASLPNGFE